MHDEAEVLARLLVNHSGSRRKFAIRDHNWKLIPSQKMPFDLDADPGEQQNLWTKNPVVVQRLHARLATIQQAQPAP